MKRTLIAILSLSAALTVSAPARAAEGACWNRDVERLDFLENPPEGGDNRFFTGISDNNGNTNVTLVWPTHATLMEFTQRLYRIRVDLGGTAPTGCSNSYLNSLAYFMPTGVVPPAGPASLQGLYSPTTIYPDPGPTYSGGNGESDNLSVGSAYRYRNWPSGTSSVGTAENFATACLNAGGLAQQAACLSCLNTKGYWLNPAVSDNSTAPGAGVFATNWLRFHPVKWVMLALAYKRLVNGPLLLSLREAVLAQSGSKGTTLIQKMLPQSCGGNGRPLQQKITAIDGLSYTSTAYPLAEMLFNAAWYMGGQSSPWLFSNSSTIPSNFPNSKSGPCVNCKGDFIVLFGDGRGDSANAACAPSNGATPAWCTATAQCSSLGMGVEDDGNDFLDPTLAGGAGSAISGPGVRQTPGGTCDMDLADDVASWMSKTPVGIGYANSTLRTYVVAIGDPKDTYGEMTTLKEIAGRGGGDYVVADDFANLESNIEQVFLAIVNRATSFSTASITTVQNSGYTSAFIPRFTPNGGQQWPGTVSRFNLYNEFAAGCTSADWGKVTTANPNGDRSCNDFYLTDSKNNFVGESNGAFVVLDNNRPWDAGWPIKGSDPGIPATPFWEASTVLTQRENAALAGDSSKERKIYTVAPDGHGGYDPTLIQFTTGNASALTPLFGLGGVSGDFCTTLASLTRHIYVTETDCGKDLIEYVNGRDLLFQNEFNRTNPPPASYRARPNLLGDIFHSTPVLVTPPVPTYLCDLGVVNQCVPSLYDPRLGPGGIDAYNSWMTANQYRQQFLLVGANDGMLHAFNAGNDVVASGVHSFDLGTGEELWAFVPPDLLPKLIRYAIGDRHELLVDGTPMVRDVWVDANSDRKKQSGEFHTLAVVGQREGGRSYFALDVTDPSAPRFLWSFPQTGTNDSLVGGETWNDLGPAPPPIGPIAEADASGPFKANGVPARERYVVAVGGGFDPAYLRGRAIYVLDVWTGQQVYRFANADASGSSDLRTSLFPVAAPVSLADTDSDGIFDTAVVGDTGGQVWTVGMGDPGRAGSSGLYTNWYAARAFIQFDGQPFWHRSPFFQRAVVGLLPGNIWRLFMGAGDRDQIKDPNGGTCGLSNLGACLRKNCSVTVSASKYRIGPSGSGGHYQSGGWTFKAGASEPTASLSSDSPPSDPSDSCSDVVDAKIDTSISCGNTSAQYSAQAYCDWSPGVVGGVDCPIATGRPGGASVDYSPSFNLEYSRFYSVRLFDSARAQFTTSGGAKVYDDAALSDGDLVNADTTAASSTGSGWYVRHANSSDERTASSAFVLDGCVLWSTLKPNPVQQLSCSSTLPLDTAYAYQAEAIGGGIQCGSTGGATSLATARFIPRSTYVTPQQPALVVSINGLTGQVSYGGVTIEPGAGPLSATTGVNDMVSPIHWLEVPPQVHECRHGGNCAN